MLCGRAGSRGFFGSRVVTVKDTSWLRLTRELCFVLTEHGSMNGHLFRLSLGETAYCWCVELEIWMHVLVDCPLYAEGRDSDACE